VLGDPKEYREHAARCAELAVEARTPQLRAVFMGLFKHWEKIQSNWKMPLPNLPRVKLLWRMSESPSMRLNGSLTYPHGNNSPPRA
jgi:hypothetical protein